MTGFRHRVFAGLVGVVLGGLAPACSHAGEWVSLFDGKTLSGWTQGGGAGRASGRSWTAPSWAPARRRCSTAPRATTRTSSSAPRSRSTTTATRACTSAAPSPTAASPTATRPRSTAPTATRSGPARSTASSTSTSRSSRPTPGSPTRSRSWTRTGAARRSRTSRSRSTARCSTSSSSTTKAWEHGPLRLPAARPGQQGPDPQDRGHGAGREGQVTDRVHDQRPGRPRSLGRSPGDPPGNRAKPPPDRTGGRRMTVQPA